MVYVQRGADGCLMRVEHSPFAGMTEILALENEELQAWLSVREDVQARMATLKNSDLELVRVLEDLVDVLVARGVIRYTDLPEAARIKLHARAETRSRLGGLSDLLSNEEHRLLL